MQMSHDPELLFRYLNVIQQRPDILKQVNLSTSNLDEFDLISLLDSVYPD